MSPQLVMAGTAVSVAGVAVITAINQPDPVTPLAPLSLTNNLSHTNLDSTQVFRLPDQPGHDSLAPGVYVTHPWVIAVLVPGQIDPGMRHNPGQDEISDDWVKNPHLRFDRIK